MKCNLGSSEIHPRVLGITAYNSKYGKWDENLRVIQDMSSYIVPTLEHVYINGRMDDNGEKITPANDMEHLRSVRLSHTNLRCLDLFPDIEYKLYVRGMTYGEPKSKKTNVHRLYVKNEHCFPYNLEGLASCLIDLREVIVFADIPFNIQRTDFGDLFYWIKLFPTLQDVKIFLYENRKFYYKKELIRQMRIARDQFNVNIDLCVASVKHNRLFMIG